MKNNISFFLLLISFIFISAQNTSVEYEVEKKDYAQSFILDIFPNESFFYSAEYCNAKGQEIFNHIKIEKKNKEIFLHDEIENIKVYFKPNIRLTWEILPETQVENGIKLNKAKTQYRDIEYIAWYDPNIPINEGPFIFNNLPGLIYKLESKEIKINLVKIQNSNLKCIGIPSKEKEISEDVYKKYNEDMLDYINKGFNNKLNIFEKDLLDSVLSSSMKKDIFRDLLF